MTALLIIKAAEMAQESHKGQVRKYTGEPYYEHPKAVAKLVMNAGLPDKAVAAALLHDVVEDCDVTLDEVACLCGYEVAELVEMLTDVSRPEDGNRASRKKIDLEHTAKANYLAKSIKCADLIDNSRSIVEHDPKFAKVYMKEKKALLEVLVGAESSLYNMAKKIVEDYYS